MIIYERECEVNSEEQGKEDRMERVVCGRKNAKKRNWGKVSLDEKSKVKVRVESVNYIIQN